MASNGDENVTIVIRIKDAASAALKKVKGGTEEVDGAAQKAGKGLGGVGKGLGAIGKAGPIAAAGVALVTAGVLALGAGMAEAVKLSGELLDDWSEQREVATSLADSYSRAGLGGKELNEALEAANALAGDLAFDTMFGDEEILGAMERYIRLTDDATAGREELDVILGIAAKTEKEAAEAAEIYAKALKGEIGPLKDLTPLTAKQEEELAKLKGTAEQTAYVQELLTDRFAGFAQQVSPTQNAIKNVEDAYGDLRQALGGVIEASGLVPVVMEPVRKVLRALEAEVYNNSEEWQHWILDGVIFAANGLDRFLGMVIQGLPILDAMLTTVTTMANAWQIWFNVVQILAKGLASFIVDFVGTAIEKLSQLQDVAIGVAEALGLDGMAGMLREGQAAAAGFGRDLQGLSDGLDASMVDDMKDIEGHVQDIRDGMENTGEFTKEATKRLEGARDVIKDMRDKASEAKENVKALNAATVGAADVTGGGGMPGALPKAPEKKDGKGAAKRAAAEEARRKKEAQEAIRDEIASLKLQAAQTRDNEIAALLLRDARLLELDARRASMTLKEQELAQYELEEDFQKRLADLATDKGSSTADNIREISDALGELDLGDSPLGKIQDEIVGLGHAAADVFDEMSKGGKLTGESVGKGLGAAGQAVAGFAEAAGAGAQAQAGILAVFEAAQAAAAFASGNIPSGIQHTIAAGLYAQAAATSAPSVGSGTSGPSASSGGSATARSSLDARELMDMQSASLVEALQGAQMGGDVNVFVDQRNSVNGAPTPETKRQFAGYVRDGMESMGMLPSSTTQRRARL